MRRNPYPTLVTGLAVLAFAVFGVLAADAANPPSFTPVVNPLSQIPADGSFLSATTCPAAGQCVAIGQDANLKPVVLTGDPSTWSMAQAREVDLGDVPYGSDAGHLYALACTSPTWCVAVGRNAYQQPLALAGNPATWGVAQAKDTFGYLGTLNSVACTSSTWCVAVGREYDGQPLVLRGNPATWGYPEMQEITLGAGFGSGGSLASVACTSSTSCVAVGGDKNGQPLTLVGNPATWGAAQAQEITLGAAFGVPDSSFENSLDAVACASSASCAAVGEDVNGQPLVLAGDPATWGAAQAQEIALGAAFGYHGMLQSVACASSTSCVAVGADGGRVRYNGSWFGRALVLAGDPATWGAGQAHEVAAGDSGLASVACSSSAACLAVGDDHYQPLQLVGDPATWAPAQAHEVTLGGAAFGIHAGSRDLACPSAMSCFDLGYYNILSGGGGRYLLHGNPATWNQAAPIPLTQWPWDTLTAMDCTSPTYCVGVGADSASTISGTTLWLFVRTGNPVNWGAGSGRAIDLGKAFGSVAISSIACRSATYCVAVGSDHASSGPQPFVIAGNPSTWTAANAKELTMGAARHSAGSLASVACTSRTLCVAVGSDGLWNTAQQQPLVLVGNPSTWGVAQTKQLTLRSSLGSHGGLSFVACPSTTYCVSVGASPNDDAPLVLVGNPAKWNARQLFDLVASGPTRSSAGANDWPSGFSGGISVSCKSTTYCVAVGADISLAPIYVTGNPALWKGKKVSRPAKHGPSFQTAMLTTTACNRLGCYVGGAGNGGDFVATVK